VSSQQLTGYSATSAERQRQLERDVIARPAPDWASAHSRALSAEPHVAGTPAQARTRDYVIEQMKAMGLETEVRAYDTGCRIRRAFASGARPPTRRSWTSAKGPSPRTPR
jgi:hypothetical protein